METATQPVTAMKTDAAPEMISAGQIVAKMLKQLYESVKQGSTGNA